MIDLSFLTDEEQEAILKVLQRDSDLKKAEEERVRHLSEKVKDEIQVKNMSGQWFYEAKSKRHREKIHGADIIRASMRRKPFPTAELSQSKSDKTKSSWVNNVNKEVFTPPELLGAVKEAQVESKSDESPKVFSAASDALETPQEKTRKLAASPSKQRKNPFNESTLLEDSAKNEQPEHGMAMEKERVSLTCSVFYPLLCVCFASCFADPHSVGNQPKVDVTNHSRVEESHRAPVEPNDLPRQAGKPPVPKARRNIHKTSDVSSKSEESFPQAPKRIKQVNGQGSLPRGILKRSSSSSSTDSEVFRLNQTLEPSGKSGLPAPTVLERVAEKSPPPPGESEGFSENSLERLKQVRFSSSVSRKERPQSLELHEGKESGEFRLLDSDDAKANGNGAGDPGALQSRHALPSKPPRAHSPALNGNAESQGEGTAPGSHGAKSSGLPSNTLQPERHPVAGPTIPSESPSKTFPAMREEQTNPTKPQIKTKPPSLEQDTSKSTADQQLPKTEDSQVPNVGSADLEQGKQARVEAPSAKTVSKSDKYNAEILKAADESISKVLDWFKRSSSDDEKETLPEIPQDARLAEEMDIPKARESAAMAKDKDCSSDMFNLHSSVRERKEPASKDYRFHEMVNGGSPFTKDGSPGSLLLGDQSETGEVASSSSQGQGIHLNERTRFQTIGQPANERDERAVEGKVETEDKSALCKEPKILEDAKGKQGLKSVGSSFGKVTGRGDVTPEGGRGVKAFLEGANSEHRSGGEESGHLDEKNSQHPSRGDLLTLPQDESKESSLIEVPRKVKNIRAFWEREAMNPKLANKEGLLSESTAGSNRIPIYKEECSRIKPVGGSSGYVTGESDNEQGSEEELNPVMEALKRSSNRQIPSKSLEDIPSATSNKGKVNLPKEDLMLSAEDDQKADQPDENAPGISTAPSFPDRQFSHPEKIKRMSKSVPTFTQEESDGRETDTASDSSYPLGRIKKSPSSLTNLSGSSGLASLSSVSTSVMSIYSGDFGNVDVKGNLQFAIDYVEQLKELHIFVAQGKDLAIADVKKQRSDPYVKSYLLPEKYKLGKRKTSVKKKTLNPVFNEILRYKVDRALLASQRLNVSVWHNDTFGRNSFLGEVELDLGEWDWDDRQNKQMIWYPLKPRTPLAGLDLENRGDMKIALQYVPQPVGGKKHPVTGEVHIWVKECSDLPVLRGNRLNSFVKCTILPDTSRKSRQKTRAVAKTTNPVFNHTMVYDGFRPQDLKEACVELTVWDHNKLANHFLGGLRIGLGTGKSYGTPVDWMDSTTDESNLWERMIDSPNTWVEDTLPLRMLMMAKAAK
ncbi:synaptotagmin-like protein 2 [Lacerta agilis]|uniref:synaptotagmin-like protein 2 n=1 Tax=Lacerta agilis TaxID=80427 RepID=UPI001419B122|nr:synaptotagmin-like protein 2 [Lacerta agilis]